MFTNYRSDTYGSHAFGVYVAYEDRDRSRAAAERYFLLQSLPERRPAVRSPKRSVLRRLLALSPSAASQPGRAGA